MEWGSSPLPGRYLPPGKTRYPFYRRLIGPKGRSGRAENLIPTGIRSRTVQPVISRYTDWATRPICNYNRPNFIVWSSNSTQGILHLVVTENFECRSTDWIKRIIEVRRLQVYYHSYWIHLSSSIQTKSFVSVTARKFYYRPSLSFQLALSSISQEYRLRTQLGLVSRPHPWSSINSCPIDVCRKIHRMLLCTGGQSGDKFTSHS